MFKHIAFLLTLTSSAAFCQDDDPILSPCNVETECYGYGEFPTSTFTISKKFESDSNVAIYQTPLLADVTGDCIPELIVAGNTDIISNPRVTKNIRVINSIDGSSLFEIPTAFFGWSSPTSFAVADVDGSGLPVVIVAAAGTIQNPINVRQRLVCYEMDGTIRWIADSQFGTTQEFGFGPSVSLADFNSDGIPEVYILNEIFNAQTGVKLTEGGNNGVGKGDETYLIGTNAAPVAAQLDDNPDDLELAAGYTVYKVSITNPEGTDGNSMTPHNIAVDGQFRDGITSIGDITGNGSLEVVVTSGGVSNAMLYVYSFQTQSPELIAQVNPPHGGGTLSYKIGSAFIGDMDGDGQSSIGISRTYLLLAYTYDGTPELQEKWSLPTNDQSGETGLTMFDFNQDGVQEIVYRDETTLRIINGQGNIAETLTSFECTSTTGNEYPIVGDIDGSGQSKICVTCGPAVGGRVEVFETGVPSQPWAPSRGVWNQYSYHIFNVNDDLTIPTLQLNNATYGGGLFNSYYAQAPLIDYENSYLLPLPDLSVDLSCTEINLDNEVYTYILNLENLPTATGAVNEDISISVFAGTVDEPGQLIETIFTNVNLLPGQTANNLNWDVPFSMLNDLDELFFVVNYSNDVFDTDLQGTEGDIEECDFNNNIEQQFIPHVEYSNIFLCEGSTYMFFEETISVSGTYTNTQLNQFGCDSLITVLTVEEGNSFQSENISACEEYYWELSETTYTESGTYQVSLINENGCEANFEINLSVNFPSESYSYTQACDQFLWSANDSLIVTSGTYQTYLSTIHGCDSLVTLEIEVNESTSSSMNTEACGEYEWYDSNLTESGSYNQFFETIDGCDSLEVLNLTIHPQYDIIETINACNSFEIAGVIIEESGFYTFSNLTQNGCDSTYSINLQLSYDQYLFEEASICQGSEHILPDGTVVTMEEVYTIIIPTIAQCDSVISTELTVIPTVETVFDTTLCENQLFILPDGSNVDPPGVFSLALSSILTGCDSIVTFNVEETPSPDVAFTWEPTPVPIDNAIIQTINFSDVELEYYWFYNNVAVSTEFAPTLDLNGSSDEVKNQLCLQVVNELGCENTMCTEVGFEVPLYIHCPNAFTPDNDGINDVFKPVISGHSDNGYLLSIYNRWGEKIFETSDPNEGWMGNYQRGEYYVPNGIYVWTLNVKSRTADEVHSRKGHVSIIR